MSLILLLLGISIGYRISQIFYKRQFEYAQTTYNKILKKTNKVISKTQTHHLQKLDTIFGEYERLKNIIQQKYQQNIQSIETETSYLYKEIEDTENSLEKQNQKLKIKKQNMTKLLRNLESLSMAFDTIDKKYKNALVAKIIVDVENIKRKILSDLEKKLIHEKDIFINKYVNCISLYSENMAKRSLTIILQKCSFSHWHESYPNAVFFEDFDFTSNLLEKTNIKNILLENLDVTIDLQKENNVLFLHGSDGYSREVARRTLKQLLLSRISNNLQIEKLHEDVCSLIKTETEEEVRKICDSINIVPIPNDLSCHMARLKYRTSFGQNILGHSKEVAVIATLLATELHFDPMLAKRSGFLHDIGKAIDHKESGGHSAIGKVLLEKVQEKKEVIEGVVEHHEDVSIEKPYASLVNIADAISASRPGARRETIEKYLKKLSKLEAIAKNMEGIHDAYAVSAGKEVRVIVDPDKVSDEKAKEIAKKMAQTIEKELFYSGVVKIIVIREKVFETYS